MRLRSPARTLSSLTGIVVLAAVLWLLLNFVYAPSCGKFGCSYTPYWASPAAAASGSCPDSYRAARDDAGWAADRYETIKDAHDTTGIFFDEDGEPHRLSSGDEKGADADRATNVLREVGATPAGNGSFPAATHVEVKVAALMRENRLASGLLVINHVDGPCAGQVGLSCREVLSLVLAPGTTLRVWFPTSGGAMDHQDYQGK